MARAILIKPILTEKSNKLSNDGRYSFVVDKNANKIEIGKAIEKMYSVTVSSVNTMVMPSKSKNRNTKTSVLRGRKPSYKKAVIQLADGESISFFEGEE